MPRPHPTPLRSLGKLAPALALCTSLLGISGCSKHGLISLMPGVINDPSNRTLRREIMSFGSKEFCKELKKRGTGLRFRDDQPVIGRFWARNCGYRELPNGDVVLQFSGEGYAWSQATLRIGFEAGGSVHYNPDFLMHKDTLYAYFRTRNVQTSKFSSLMVESTQRTVFGAAVGGGAKQMADRIGTQMVRAEAGRGFTVLRDADGQVDHGLGIVEKGRRPFHPYNVHGSSKATLLNERLEVRPHQRDFLGPFHVGDDRSLFVTLGVDGAEAVDVFLLPSSMGRRWLGEYLHQSRPTPLPGTPIATAVVRKGRGYRSSFPVPEGDYFLVIDHTKSAGSVAPAHVLAGGSAPAVVNAAVQVGDRP